MPIEEPSGIIARRRHPQESEKRASASGPAAREERAAAIFYFVSLLPRACARHRFVVHEEHRRRKNTWNELGRGGSAGAGQACTGNTSQLGRAGIRTFSPRGRRLKRAGKEFVVPSSPL